MDDEVYFVIGYCVEIFVLLYGKHIKANFNYLNSWVTPRVQGLPTPETQSSAGTQMSRLLNNHEQLHDLYL